MADLRATLDRAAQRVAFVFVDRCVVTYDAQGTSDDELDLDTGVMEPPFGTDSVTVYDGPCAISSPKRAASDNAREQLRSVPLPTEASAKVLTPASAPLFPAGAIVECTASRDPALVGRRYRVPEGTAPSSFSVLRSTPLEVLP